MRKLFTFIGVLAAMVTGAFILNAVVPASAGQLSSQTSQATETPSQSTPPACGAHLSLKDVLDNLVKDGTISQDQEDKIVAALKAAHEANKAANAANATSQPRTPRLNAMKAAVQVAADKIGVTVEELKSAVQGGQSIADVAAAHNVAQADVEQAIVDAGNTKVDAAVTAGTLTQQQGQFAKNALPEAANRLVTRKGVAPTCGPDAGTGTESSGSSSSSSSSGG